MQKGDTSVKTIYAIRDRIANDLAGTFPLVVMRTDAQAIRYFGDSMSVEKSALHAHPQDYELVECGLVDDNGAIQGLLTPRVVITGDALISALAKELPQLKMEA